jgi:hypothetical protein
MAETDPDLTYAAMKAAGATPQEVCARCLEAGLPKVEVIRALRSLFAVPFSEAKEILEGLEGPQSREALFELLKDQLGYCDCASSDAMLVLREVLRTVQDKTDRASDAEALASASRRIVELLGPEGRTGLGEWFVYFLESRGLIYHGFRVTDLSITERGRGLLRAIERFGRPRVVDTEAEE